MAFIPTKEAKTEALKAVEKAIMIDEASAEAWELIANIKLHYEWDWDGAEEAAKRAASINPLYGNNYLYALSTGQFNRLAAEEKRSVNRDPLNLSRKSDLAWAYFYNDQYDEAISELERVLEIDPNFLWAHMQLAQCYVMKERYEEAISEADKTRAIIGNTQHEFGLAMIAWVYGKSSQPEKTREIIGSLLHSSEMLIIDPYSIAIAYDGLSEVDSTLTWLERGYEQRSPQMLHMRMDFGHLSDESRYQELVRLVGFPH
jgi:tetratricopeptide (TPR) repeat protein